MFLFDEPLSNLDAKLRASMRIRISDLHKQLKKSGKPATTVYVTHDQTEAMTMGDRICVMKLGHIMQVDTPDNLYHKPKKHVRGRLYRRPGDEYSPQQTG
ncbi:Maltose/maltodextrin import ATP-binding protein MalK [Raoultella ornithinolytica]|nr:Maltose/maltodextrin import ATP-binding protein MalK [Raoultella ornithinolytica]